MRINDGLVNVSLDISQYTGETHIRAVDKATGKLLEDGVNITYNDDADKLDDSAEIIIDNNTQEEDNGYNKVELLGDTVDTDGCSRRVYLSDR